MKFYQCEKCGNIITYLDDAGVIPVCCNETMKELVCNKEEQANEKHIPVVERNQNMVSVTIGSILHPSTLQHHIRWIVLTTDKGYYIHPLNTEEIPITYFAITSDERIQTVYAYCNIHGLWKRDVVNE